MHRNMAAAPPPRRDPRKPFMIKRFSDFEQCHISASDGVIGRVSDMYFDDQTRRVRYLVVDIESGPLARQVLISPISVGAPDWSVKSLPATITKRQAELSPDIDTVKPVSRQYEMRYCEYYKYPFYWDAPERTIAAPGVLVPAGRSAMRGSINPAYRQARAEGERLEAEAAGRLQPGDSHLRSMVAIMKYDVHATDGDVGRIEDIFVDDRSWQIDSMLIRTTKWALFPHRAVIAAGSITDVSRPEERVTVKLTRDEIRNIPPYEPRS